MEVDVIVTRGPEAGRSVRLRRFPVVIGREPGCDLVLSDPSVSRRHARIRLDATDLILEDLSSKLGILVNGQRVRQCRVSSSTQVSLGNTEVRLLIVSASQPVAAPVPIDTEKIDVEVLIHAPDGTSRSVLLSKPETIFGRDASCDVPVDDFKMSQRHFRIRRAPHQFVLEDLRSTNGTYVDGRRESWGELRAGARIVAGRSRFLVRFLPRADGARPAPPPSTELPKPKYAVEHLPHRGLLFSSVGPQPPIGKFLTGLSRLCPMGLLVDALVRDRISTPLPTDAVPLYDWMDPALAERASPVLICSEAAIPMANELSETDGWVAYFAEASPKDLLTRLRSHAHPPTLKNSHEPPADSAAPLDQPKPISLSRPSILVALARYGDEGFLGRLLSDIKAAVMEGVEPDSWQAFATDGFRKALKTLGFVQANVEPDARP